MAGDIVKYGIDSITGTETRSFGSFSADTATNALFDGVWGFFPGKYVTKFKKLLKDSGGKLLLEQAEQYVQKLYILVANLSRNFVFSTVLS